LIKARIQFESDLLPVEELRQIEKLAIEQTVKELDQIVGSTIVTDGEQTKPSFLTYPIYDLVFDRYKFDDKCFSITFSDGKSTNVFTVNSFFVIIGHVRTLPRLIKAPFQYATYAYKYLDVAKKLTKKPIKQAVITASALSMVYAPHLLKTYQIENYSHEQFLKDLVNECEKDIRLCLGEFIIYSLFEIELILF
jgi:5-methyltetrahydropteroyltriglutamate--homocysteine methyltransferase